ncbi:MAG: hypothetical protein ACRC06_16630 [Waterburya sp.]
MRWGKAKQRGDATLGANPLGLGGFPPSRASRRERYPKVYPLGLLQEGKGEKENP